MTQQEATELTATLAAMYDVPAWQPARLRGFATMIRDLDHEPTEIAVGMYLQTHHERPTPDAIRAGCVAVLEQAGAIPADMDPDQFLSLLRKATSVVKADGRFPKEKYPLAWEAIEATGGWLEFIHSTNPETHRAQLRAAYVAILARQRNRRLVAPGLRLPEDAERLALLAKPADVPQVEHVEPTSPERAKAIMQEILASLPPPAPPEPEYIAPSPADLREAEQRRANLLEQLHRAQGEQRAA